eukprot:COSAG02_NODE_15135_length_1200_cov_44.120862_2_plen_70_part_00
MKVQVNCAVWVKQGSSRYWPCVSRSLEDVAEDSLRRELQNQIRKIQAKHPDRVATEFGARDRWIDAGAD